MPAYSFQMQFCGPVERGEKTHTIRGKRKARPKPGQRFVGYFGMRTKACRKLIESTIARVQDVFMSQGRDGVVKVDLDGERLSPDQCEALARRDGFPDWATMQQFWVGRYPFSGDMIHWKFPGVK